MTISTDSSQGASTSWQSRRPDHFSTYVPRDLIRRLKVVAAIRDVPLWSIVTDALDRYLASFEEEHGRLPQLKASSATDASQGGQ